MTKKATPVRIVVLDKGFVAVGVYEQGTEWCSLSNCGILRYWGTTRGLGEIAENGPTSTTKLDPTPKMTFPVHAIVNTIDCVESKWKKVLDL